MMFYFKIWLKVVKKSLNVKTTLMFFVGHVVLYLAIYLLSSYNIGLSFILLLLLMIIRSVVRLFVYYRKLIDSHGFEQILLKPIDPLIGLLVYNRNPADILVLAPILVYLKIKNYKINGY